MRIVSNIPHGIAMKLKWVHLFFSCSVVSNSFWPHGLQHTRLPCPSPSPGVCSNSCSLSQWCHPTILSSVVPFSCLQSFPASGSFLMSWLFIRWPKYWSFSFSIILSNAYCRVDFLNMISNKFLSVPYWIVNYRYNDFYQWYLDKSV